MNNCKNDLNHILSVLYLRWKLGKYWISKPIFVSKFKPLPE